MDSYIYFVISGVTVMKVVITLCMSTMPPIDTLDT